MNAPLAPQTGSAAFLTTSPGAALAASLAALARTAGIASTCVVAIVAATLATTPAPARAQPASGAGQQLVALCSTDARWCDVAAAEFARRTGIKVLSTRRPTGEAFAQIRAEAENPRSDIWWGGTGDPFLQAADEGLLAEYRPAGFDDLQPWSQNQYAISGNRAGGFYSGVIGFGLNTEVLKRRNLPVPRCWSDLLKPEYKGEIESSHPATSGGAYTILAGLVALMGEDKAFDYMKALHRNVAQYTRSSTAQAKSVARGEVGIGISFVHGFITEIESGFPVDVVVPCEGTSYEVGGIALIKGARNAEAARRFYDFLMSPEGQALGASVKNYQQPANRKVPPDPKVLQSDKVKLVSYDFRRFGDPAERRRLIGRWEREIGAKPN